MCVLCLSNDALLGVYSAETRRDMKEGRVVKHLKVLSKNRPRLAQDISAKPLIPELGFWDWWVLVTQALIWLVSWLGPLDL